MSLTIFFKFSLYLNDIQETCIRGKFQDIEICMLKLFLLLYADGIVIFADNENVIQKTWTYCMIIVLVGD